MKKYIVDTNFILRFMLRDNIDQYNQVENLLKEAQEEKVEIKVTTEVVMEIEYVLRKHYKVARIEIAQNLLDLMKSNTLVFEKKFILTAALEKYKVINVDLVDILLFFQAQKEKSGILTFDKDFNKLK